MSNKTSIGRVQPLFKGDYSSNIEYEKLDNVLYNGSTYVALSTVPAGATNLNPVEASDLWQLVAEKGEIGSIASVCVVGFSEAGAGLGWASASIEGELGSQAIKFNFGIPAGPTGSPAAIASISATASVGSIYTPKVTVQYSGGVAASATFNFTFPPTESNVKSVDGKTVSAESTTGDVILNAVRYTSQSLTAAEKSQARENIQAALKPAGNPAYNTAFITYTTKGYAAYTSIREVPAPTGLDKVLTCVSGNNYAWRSINTVPAISSTDMYGYVLVATSTGAYWKENTISIFAIDNLFS